MRQHEIRNSSDLQYCANCGGRWDFGDIPPNEPCDYLGAPDVSEPTLWGWVRLRAEAFLGVLALAVALSVVAVLVLP